MQRDIKVDKIIMDNFYKLVHSQENIRITAASSTYKILNSMKNNRPQAFNENLNYSIERLVAGLASSRAQARRGFGTLLFELLKSFNVSTERLLSIAENKFAYISKETSRDNLLGYYLLIVIILESGNYKRAKGNASYLEKIYKYLIQLHNTKSYMEYPVSKVLVEYHEQFHSFMVNNIPAHGFESDSKVTALELLSIVLCHKVEPIRKLATIDKAQLMNLCSILLDNRFHKRPLHPVFVEVSKFVIDNFPQHFEQYYKQLLRPTFFKADHNQLASMALELIATLIEATDNKEVIKVLLDEHLIKSLILSLRNNTSLKLDSVKFFKSLQEMFKKQPNGEKQFAIVDALTTAPGSIKFDEDSKSSSLRDLLQLATHDTLVKYLDKLMRKSMKPKRDELQSSANQIGFIIRRPQMLEDLTTKKKVAQYSLTKIVAEEPLDGDVKSSFVNAYHAILDQIVSSTMASDRIEQLNDLIDFYDQMESEENQLWEMYKPALEEYRKLIKKYQDSKLLYPITTLFLFYGFQVIEHKLDCQEQLQELIQSAEVASKGDKEDNSWADILTDQIIAILSATECKPWMRKTCEKVFTSLSPYISDTSIQLICDAIKAPDLDGEDDDSCDSCLDEDEENSAESCEGEDEESCDETGDVEEPMEVVAESDDEKDDQKQDIADEEDSQKEANDEDEDDEEYLDDEQMMKMDSVIADMFKLNRKKKTDPAFKLRCLDLIKVLLKKNKNPEVINTALATVIPLYFSSRKSAETRPISTKIVGLLSKVQGKSKYPELVKFLEKQQPNIVRVK